MQITDVRAGIQVVCIPGYVSNTLGFTHLCISREDRACSKRNAMERVMILRRKPNLLGLISLFAKDKKNKPK